MKALLIDLDPDTAARLDKVAPSRSRRRSEFIRAAIRRALWELEERATEAAYLHQPDSAKDVYVDPDAWEEALPRHRRARSRRRG
ncbi:MAG: ribbon-helix-helix protein, CopG family [Candidatus Rokubacteria bacterium]|nr:ribbon-helix-helix protein, CopG family [Candidatus Rokubacteria bacterium]